MRDQVLSEHIPTDCHDGHGKHKHHFHRKDAKKFFYEIN